MIQRKIIWDKQAVDSFREAIAFIKKDSVQNAAKVKEDVLKRIVQLSAMPEIHPPDKFKIDNNGNYRAFELYRFRMGYLVKEEEIIIIRFRNTNQEPLEY